MKHYVRRSGKNSLRLRHFGRDFAGRKQNDRRKYCGKYGPHARPLKRTGRRVCRLRHLSEYKDFYAFHIFYNDNADRVKCEIFLKNGFEIVKAENIPIRKIPEITDVPIIWRYFVAPLSSVLSRLQLDEKEYVARMVTKINTKIDGAYVFFQRKEYGGFQGGVGFPEDVGRFYRLGGIRRIFLDGSRSLPTNTPGWWAGPIPLRCLIIP